VGAGETSYSREYESQRSRLTLVIAAGSLSHLGTSGALGHDDLVHLQDGCGRANSVLETPELGLVQIEELCLRCVDGAGLLGLNVEADCLSGLVVVGQIQLVDDFRAIDAGVLGQSLGENFQRISELAHGVLVQTRQSISIGGQLGGQLDLGGASSGQIAAIPGQALEVVNSVIQGTLNVIHEVVGSSTDHHGGNARVLALVPAMIQ